MTANEPVLEAWKARSQIRRERLQRWLSATLPPWQAARRTNLVRLALNSVGKQKDWAGAIDSHLGLVRELLDREGSSAHREGSSAHREGSSASKTKSGSLSD